MINSGMTRRHYFRHLAASAIAVPGSFFLNSLHANAAAVKKGQKRCILLWMSGGPSHMDTWDLKPGTANGGPFKPIETSAPGVLVSPNMPTIAKQMKHIAVLRSLNSREGSHERGTYLMHTGNLPVPTIEHPGFGSILSYELGTKLGDFPLPTCVAVNGGGFGPGFLGMSHAPFAIGSPGGPIENMNLPGSLQVGNSPVDQRISQLRTLQREAMWRGIEGRFMKTQDQSAADHATVYKKTKGMIFSPMMQVFKLDDEPAKLKEAYGDNSFGKGCLLARRLVEQGVPFVEVQLGGWDTHAQNFDALTNNLQPTLDKGMGTLIADLDSRGLLQDTLVVWMGEFGRTPRINQDAGRDHWGRSWSIAMAGGGIKGGQAVGSTDADGVEITD
ncbi:MAG: DUF1501 domain-containing protein, partial [bacterium]